MSHAAGVEHYRSADIRRFSLWDNSEVVYFVDDAAAHTLPSDLARLLDKCKSFQTLDEHAKQLRSVLRIDPNQDSEIRRVLEDFVRAGLLLSQSHLLSRCVSGDSSTEASAQIESVGLITRDRTDSLNRALLSYIENNRRFGRTNSVVVIDDSERPETREQHRRLLSFLRKEHNVDLRYAGLEEKSAFAKLLSSADLPLDVVEYALLDVEGCGCAIGANRNALLLDTAGELLFSADDDTVCRMAVPPGRSSDLSFWSEADPTEFWFFPCRDAAVRSALPVECDLLAAHEQFLGKTFGSILKQLSPIDQVSLQEPCPQLIRSLQRGSGRVALTLNGLIGDSGIPSPVGFITSLRGNSRARFTQSEYRYRSALVSRDVLRIASSASIYHGTQFMSLFFGLDNRTLVPPFVPVQRNEDGVFGLTLNLCFPDAYFTHLPLALMHAADERTYPADFMAWVSRLGVADIFMFCMTSWQLTPAVTNAAARMRSLGSYLADLGRLDSRGFKEFVRVQMMQRMSQRISALERILKTYDDTPAFWATDLKRYLSTIRHALPRDDYIVPHDISHGRTSDQTILLMQRLIRKYGQLLALWPHMIDAAKSLRGRNLRLGRSV